MSQRYLAVTLPWPTGVTTNHLYARTRQGGVRLTDRARAWKDEAMIAVKQQRAGLPEGKEPVKVTILAYEPDARRRDLDNLAKLALDAVFAALDADDSRVRCLNAVLRTAIGEPARLDVIVSEWEWD